VASKVLFEGIEAVRPERSVAGQPAVDLTEAFGPQLVDATLRVGPHGHQPHLPEDAEVPRHCRLGERGERLDELAGWAFLGRQQVEDVAAGGLGDSLEHVHRGEYNDQRI
jgi:hypothetical protein